MHALSPTWNYLFQLSLWDLLFPLRLDNNFLYSIFSLLLYLSMGVNSLSNRSHCHQLSCFLNFCLWANFFCPSPSIFKNNVLYKVPPFDHLRWALQYLRFLAWLSLQIYPYCGYIHFCPFTWSEEPGIFSEMGSSLRAKAGRMWCDLHFVKVTLKAVSKCEQETSKDATKQYG